MKLRYTSPASPGSAGVPAALTGTAAPSGTPTAAKAARLHGGSGRTGQRGARSRQRVPATRSARHGEPGPVWFFDLDNTLHNATRAIFPAIAVNMTAYIVDVLGGADVPGVQEAANKARLDYGERYGATLLGMMRHHDVRAADFLHAAHQFENLRTMIHAERGLARLLEQLPGRKILLTNGPKLYARAVLGHLGLQRHFSGHVAIESMTVFRQLRPKPARALLRKMAARERVAPSRCILVEDTLANLKSARAVGMRTAWITGFLAGSRVAPSSLRKRPPYVDVKMSTLTFLRRRSARLTG